MSTGRKSQWEGRLRNLHPLTLFVAGILASLALAWWGVNDWRLPGAYRPSTGPSVSTSEPSPESDSSSGRRVLSGSSPVTVTWLGQGEALEISWDDMNYPALDHYSVDVYGLSPEQTWYNDGYRANTKLASTRVIYPVAETRVRYEETNKSTDVGPDETWRVCVEGMRRTPGGVDVGPYAIEGSRRCSDPFTVPRQ